MQIMRNFFFQHECGLNPNNFTGLGPPGSLSLDKSNVTQKSKKGEKLLHLSYSEPLGDIALLHHHNNNNNNKGQTVSE
jgi:hypothetical protein